MWQYYKCLSKYINLMIPPHKMPKLVAVLLVLAPVLVFWPVGGYAFLDWDDAAHILNNPHLLDLPYIWTHPLAGMYMPMTFTTWSALMRLFGPNPAAFHIANLCFHIASTLLVYRILLRLLTRGKGISKVGPDCQSGRPNSRSTAGQGCPALPR